MTVAEHAEDLAAAVRTGRLAAAADLLRCGANANTRNAQGLTLLMVAAGLGQSQMVELLLSAGADVLAIEPRMGASALHKAAQSGNADVIALLLQHGAFINQQSPVLGHTALMDAVIHKHAEVVRLLLERGALTNITNHTQQTALALARSDQLEKIARLIELREETDSQRTKAAPWLDTIKAGDVDAIRRLVDAGMPLNARAPAVGSADDDYTPLGLAAREGQVAIVGLLLRAGADGRRITGAMRGIPLHEASYFGHADVLRVLVALPDRSGQPAVELDAQGPYNGYTPLHDAVWHGHLEAATVLMEAGAPRDLRNHAGLTPLELALLYGYDDLVQLLSNSDANAEPAVAQARYTHTG